MMTQRATGRRPLGRRSAVGAAAGLAVALLISAPAAGAGPAAVPTISAPTSRTGYGPVTISGAASPGATVRLLESAYNWNDLRPAVDWAGAGGDVTATATSAGTYRIVRNVDSGFLFAVEVDGVRSPVRRVSVRVLPSLTLSSPRAGTVVARVRVSPNQPGLGVKVYRANRDGSWTMVAHRFTDGNGAYSVTLTNQGAGRTASYRAWVSGDPETSMTANTTPAQPVRIR